MLALTMRQARTRVARCGLAALLALLALVAAAPVWSQGERPALPPAESFVRPAQLQRAEISPSGERVALVVHTPQGRSVLAVRTLKPPLVTKVVGAFSDADVVSVRWVNDQRLVYEAFRPGAEIEEHGAGTFAVDHDGADPRQLIAWRRHNEVAGSRIGRQGLAYGWFLADTVDDGSADVLVVRMAQDSRRDALIGQLARLDTTNGRLTTLSEGAPTFATRFLLDLKGQLRVVATRRDGRQRLHWRRPGSESWTVVHDTSTLDEQELTPLALEPDGTLIVEGRQGRDTSALYAFNLERAAVDPEPLAALEGFDVGARIAQDSRTQRVVGVHTRAARCR